MQVIRIRFSSKNRFNPYSEGVIRIRNKSNSTKQACATGDDRADFLAGELVGVM